MCTYSFIQLVQWKLYFSKEICYNVIRRSFFAHKSLTWQDVTCLISGWSHSNYRCQMGPTASCHLILLWTKSGLFITLHHLSFLNYCLNETFLSEIFLFLRCDSSFFLLSCYIYIYIIILFIKTNFVMHVVISLDSINFLKNFLDNYTFLKGLNT